METIRLSTKGQLVIPNAIRKAQRLTAGTEFVVSFVGSEIRLTPQPPFATTTVNDVAGMLAKRGRARLSDETVRANMRKAIKARDQATRA